MTKLYLELGKDEQRQQQNRDSLRHKLNVFSLL